MGLGWWLSELSVLGLDFVVLGGCGAYGGGVVVLGCPVIFGWVGIMCLVVLWVVGVDFLYVESGLHCYADASCVLGIAG